MELNVDFDEKIEQLAKVPKPIRLAVVSALLVAIVSSIRLSSLSAILPPARPALQLSIPTISQLPVAKAPQYENGGSGSISRIR